MTNEKHRLFEEAAKPLIKFLNDHGNPHMCAIVDPTGAELLSGESTFETKEFVND